MRVAGRAYSTDATHVVHQASTVGGRFGGWPVSAVQAIADLVPDVRLEILPGAAHRPDIQAPDRVTETLAGFLLDQLVRARAG